MHSLYAKFPSIARNLSCCDVFFFLVIYCDKETKQSRIAQMSKDEKPQADYVAIQIRLTPAQAETLDLVRRDMDGIPSRATAARRLIIEAGERAKAKR
jgi:hypothetical protein